MLLKIEELLEKMHTLTNELKKKDEEISHLKAIIRKAEKAE